MSARGREDRSKSSFGKIRQSTRLTAVSRANIPFSAKTTLKVVKTPPGEIARNGEMF